MTTNSQLLAPQPILRRNLTRRLIRFALIFIEVILVWRLSVIGWWPAAFIVVAATELGDRIRAFKISALTAAAPRLAAGFAASWMIALYPRALSQVIIALLYFVWRVWLEQEFDRIATRSLVTILVSQAIVFEAIFLAAAIWEVPKVVVLILVWLAAYGLTNHMLTQRQDRAAGVLAAAWGLIAAEVAWVTLTWLVSYTILAGYLIVPQPAIILTVLSYSFGSIYMAQRQNQLGRRRLAEYLVIALVIIIIVIAGTTWKGSL